MKRIVTGFLLSFIVLGFSLQMQAQTLRQRANVSTHQLIGATTEPTQAAVGQNSSSGLSPVFLPGQKGLVTLGNTYSALPEVDLNFTDTTGGNWWIDPVDDSFATTVTPNGVTTPDTMYARGLSERFTTSLVHPYLDSVQITFLAASMPTTNTITFQALKISDAQFGTLGIFPAPDLSSSLKSVTIPTSSVVQQNWNTITANFHHLKMPVPSATVRPDFAILVNRGGSILSTDPTTGYSAINPYEDSIFFQSDANVNQYEDNINVPLDLDTTLYFTYNYSTDQYLGWEEQSFFFNQQTAADTTMAFFGNMIMIAYLDDPTGAGVSVDPATEYRLATNYPNPVSSTSEINYNLGASGPVTLEVYNVLGENVGTLVNSVQGAGEHTATFSVGALPDGMYYYKLQSGEFTATNTMVIAR